MQAEKAESATTTVTRLRKAVSAGKADERELEKAEGMLAGLTGSLQYLQVRALCLFAGNFAFGATPPTVQCCRTGKTCPMTPERKPLHDGPACP